MILLAGVVACGEVVAPTTDAPSIVIDAAIDAPIIDAPTDAALTVTKTGTGTGTVASTPAGIACGATCQARFPLGSAVTLTATPDVGVTVVSWGGACAGSPGNTCALTINADTAISVELGPSIHAITVTTGGNGLGNVTSTPSGLNCGNGGTQCSATFPYGTAVTLTQTAASGSLFGGWSGGVCSGIGACAFTVQNDAMVNADFALDNFTLIVTKAGNGTGTVTSSPAGINCGATCAMSYLFGQMVTLTAVPSANSVFNGWTGACTGTGTCIVAMTQSRMVTASFTLQQFTLTVTRAGTGTGTVTSSPAGINCGADCTEPYNAGTAVTLTAAAAAGSTFTGWSGACTGTGTCAVTMNAVANVTATFTLQTFLLTVNRAGAGTGTVTSSPAGINCGTTCSASYNSGTLVTLTASPAGGSTFAGWSGASCTGTGTCVVTMTAAQTVTATFNSTIVVVTIAKTGPLVAGAVISSSPAGISCGATCSGSFATGTVITLTQTPGGSLFTGWSGPCSGTGNCTFTVSASTTVTAAYRGLRVAINTAPASCLRNAGQAGDRARIVIGNRGHVPSFVAATEIDTAAEMAAYDVIVVGGVTAGCAISDADGYEATIDNYIRNTGGGIVASGWNMYVTNPSVPNLWNVLPTVRNMVYAAGTQTVTPIAGSPITNGVPAFTALQWVPQGGGPKPGAISLLDVGGVSTGASWTVGTGRSVFLGPMYIEDYAQYDNETLLDGSQPGALELFLRAIEWAGKAR